MADRAGFPPVVLFDLDGTLLDSAPDFVATIAVLAKRLDLPAVGIDVLRPVVSKGSRAMLSAAFPSLDPSAREALVPVFLSIYESLIGQHAVLFDGVAALLDGFDAAGTRWGIVTNKPEYLARLILPQHGWERRCAVLIGGDTLAMKKPDPLPLLEAARRMAVAPAHCVYVGDDERDIQAARAAAMASVAALWGYRLADDVPEHWGADVTCSSAAELHDAAVWPLVI